MGFLINIKYHPKKEGKDFGFDIEKVEEKKLKVGKIEEDISHSQLALAILKQLSRRDIYVSDVEVIEFAKKTLSVKEAKNGIIIGHKKYTFSDAKDLDSIEVEEINESPRRDKSIPQPQASAPISTSAIKPLTPRTVIREEFFDPSMPNPERLAGQFAQLGLTIGKKYKIIEEVGIPLANGAKNVLRYKVINDSGGIAEAPVQHFNAVINGGTLNMEGMVDIPGSGTDEIPLSFPGEIRGQQINVRR